MRKRKHPTYGRLGFWDKVTTVTAFLAADYDPREGRFWTSRTITYPLTRRQIRKMGVMFTGSPHIRYETRDDLAHY